MGVGTPLPGSAEKQKGVCSLIDPDRIDACADSQVILAEER
jgi:hypothetical protein